MRSYIQKKVTLLAEYDLSMGLFTNCLRKLADMQTQA